MGEITDVGKQAAGRAADWLEQHPNNHISSCLAINAEGWQIAPSSDKAISFCAVGRVARELGCEGRGNGVYECVGKQLGTMSNVRALYRINDDGIPANTIAALRKLSKGVDIYR